MATPPVEEKASRSEAKTIDLLRLDELLLFKDGQVKRDLQLKDPQRRLIHQDSLKHKSKKKEYRVFLLDHFLIITKSKIVDGREQLQIVYHPIPVQLLHVSLEQARSAILGCIPSPLGKTRHWLRFSSLGQRFNNGKALMLLSSSAEGSKAWVDIVNAQRDVNQQNPQSNVLRLGQDLLMGNGEIKVNCASLYENGQTIAYGTDDGVYFQPHNGRPRKAIDLTGVRQIDVLEDLSLLVVLAERSVFTFPLDALDRFDRMSRMSRIAKGKVSFLKTGTCLGRTMVCLVNATLTSSTIKMLQQNESESQSNLNRTLKTLDKADKLKDFKVFHLSTESYSVQFLKTKLCVAGPTGFRIIDLETLDTQNLLDPADNALDFVGQYKDPRPLCVYRIGSEFLLCYQEFAFYVNKNGWKSDKDVVIHWEGTPTACALHYPYVAAFSPKFVEIWHLDTGSLVQTIHESHVRCLYAEHSPLRTSTEAPASPNFLRPPSTLVSLDNKIMFLTQSSP